jgi:hypothetical protein
MYWTIFISPMRRYPVVKSLIPSHLICTAGGNG